MGRNDLCFCMSGKKNKKCQPDIHENSLAAAKLKIYGQLEQDLNAHHQNNDGIFLCVPGCSDCCHDYYTVQSIEFDLILAVLAKWDDVNLNNLIDRVDKYWKMLEKEFPEVNRLLLNPTNSEIEEINSSIDKTSFPCVFLDETTHLCQIYNSRPFKCRIFGTSYYYPTTGEGAMGIACQKYGDILNEDNFDVILCDCTKILDENTDQSIIHDKKRNANVIYLEYPLIYHLYQHFVVNKLGTNIVNYDEKFTRKHEF